MTALIKKEENVVSIPVKKTKRGWPKGKPRGKKKTSRKGRPAGVKNKRVTVQVNTPTPDVNALLAAYGLLAAAQNLLAQLINVR